MSCRDNVLNAEDAENAQKVVGKLWESCGIWSGGSVAFALAVGAACGVLLSFVLR